MIRILVLGDIVGKPGVAAVKSDLKSIRAQHNLDLVIANAENAADGSGLTIRQYDALLKAGVDAFTMGDHVYRKREIYTRLDTSDRIVKPGNFPEGSPGKAWVVVTARDGTQVALFSLLGRVYTRPVDCPFVAAERILAEIPDDVKVRILDMHAEATSEKQLMGRFLDGRVSAVLGTHTHVPTADTTIFPGGTGFQCDLGMSGPYESIIGRNIERVLKTAISFEPVHYHVATDDVRLCGVLMEIDTETGKCVHIERFEHRIAAES